jgi:exodeoxyribonuclease VII small subunit
MNEQKPIEDLTFEEAYRQLEVTVRQLEAGNLPLEQAINLYERGVALSAHCERQLEGVELRLKVLTPTGDVVDFDEG